MTSNEQETLTGAEEVRWDLSDLYASADDPQLEADLVETRTQAAAFAERYRDRVASLDAAELGQAMTELEEIVSTLVKIDAYVEMAWSVETQNPGWGQWLAKKNEHANEVRQLILFFELEWANAPQAAGALTDEPPLARYRHYLNLERLRQPYLRSEAEEKVISQLSLSGAQGWSRYFGEISSRLTLEVDGQELTLDQVISLFMRPDRELRREAADAITGVIEENSHALTFIFNMVLLEKASIDKIRGYESWISQRNLENQVDDATVEALVTAVTSRYDIVARYYRLLKGQLELETLYEYDRYAPVATAEVHVPWSEAQAVVLEAFTAFDPRFSDIAGRFFDQRWIDAPPQKGKAGGAYCALMGPSYHPYVLLNYTGNMMDVMTLAHELGHGLHAWLARGQSQFHFWPPITTSEMASTFGEMLVFDHLIQAQPDAGVRFAMRMEKMASTINTVFRQIAMNRFEEAIHTGRREDGELTTEDLSAAWLETQGALYGDSVELRPGYRLWWAYIEHFISYPGYVYGYAFGDLLVWALYARYQDKPDGFVDRYLEVLSAGGSDWPHLILAPMGVDLQEPDFWHEGLNMLDAFVSEMERDAEKLA